MRWPSTASQATGLAMVACDTAGCGRAGLWRGEPATLYPHPADDSLRRAWAWQAHPFAGEDLARVAIHEAGHVVLLEWLGVTHTAAQAGAQRGHVRVMEPIEAQARIVPRSRPDLVATAAAIFHSGTCAELIASGLAWAGPILRMEQADHQNAEKLLSPVFGAHASGAHAYAQRVALHVLGHRWARVLEVAGALAGSPGKQISLQGGQHHAAAPEAVGAH